MQCLQAGGRGHSRAPLGEEGGTARGRAGHGTRGGETGRRVVSPAGSCDSNAVRKRRRARCRRLRTATAGRCTTTAISAAVSPSHSASNSTSRSRGPRAGERLAHPPDQGIVLVCGSNRLGTQPLAQPAATGVGARLVCHHAAGGGVQPGTSLLAARHLIQPTPRDQEHLADGVLPIARQIRAPSAIGCDARQVLAEQGIESAAYGCSRSASVTCASSAGWGHPAYVRARGERCSTSAVSHPPVRLDLVSPGPCPPRQPTARAPGSASCGTR